MYLEYVSTIWILRPRKVNPFLCYQSSLSKSWVVFIISRISSWQPVAPCWMLSVIAILYTWLYLKYSYLISFTPQMSQQLRKKKTSAISGNGFSYRTSNNLTRSFISACNIETWLDVAISDVNDVNVVNYFIYIYHACAKKYIADLELQKETRYTVGMKRNE